MRIKLLKDVREDGRIKSTERASKKLLIGWYAGVEMEVSDETGKKLIERGDAEQVVVEEVAEAVEES